MKKIFFVFVYVISCLIFILFAFEFIYRWQIIDTYLPELRSYNFYDNLDDKENKKTILIMGDSFTAGSNNYPDHMQYKLQDWRIINSAISGTGVIQASIIASRRFKKFKPSIFIYQVYVGNDLFDITYPVNWENVSFSRNMYWTVSNYFRSLSFLNYRLGQMNKGENVKQRKRRNNETELKRIYNIDTTDSFSVEKYNKRERLYSKAEPRLLEDQLMVKGRRKRDFEIFIDKLKDFASYSRSREIKLYILVIPHACQINEHYLENMRSLGFVFGDNKQILNNEYPFIVQIQQEFKQNPNVQILNPIQVLKNNEKENKRMYYQNDCHLNPNGQKVIAEYILKEINLD
jgi:hypothetical protein